MEWYNLCKDIIDNHIVFLSGELDVEWQIVSIWGATYRKLVLFPAYLKHGVPSHRNDEDRIVIAGNIIAKYT